MRSPDDLPPLLAALPDVVRADLGPPTRVPRGATLFAQGDPSDTAWILLSGVLLVERSHPLSTEAQLLGVFSRGDMLGEVGLLHHTTRTATGRALTDLELLAIPRARFEALLATQAGFGAEVARLLAARLLATNELLPGVPARLVALVGVEPAVADGLASALARHASRLVAVTAWPDARGLPRRFGLDAPGRSTAIHPRGFHVIAHRGAPDAREAALLADILRQRYGMALILMDAWDEHVERMLHPDEPVLLWEGQPPLPRRFPPILLGGSDAADLRVPPESATEGFERAMNELARRVQRSIAIRVVTTSSAEDPAVDRLREALHRGLGPCLESGALELCSWAAPAELSTQLEGLLEVAANDPGLISVQVGRTRLVL